MPLSGLAFSALCFLFAPQSPVLLERWSDVQDDPAAPSIEWASAAVFSDAGELFVIGTRTSPARAAVVKYDALGSVSWSRELDFDAPLADVEGLLIAADPAGHLVVAGTSDSGWATKKDIVIAKLDRGNGATLWRDALCIDGRAGDDDVPRQILVDSRGDIFLAAHLHDAAPFHFSDIGLYKFAGRDGRVLWHTRIRGTSAGMGFDVQDEFGAMALLDARYLVVVGTHIPGGYGGGGPLLGDPILWTFDRASGLGKQMPIQVPHPNISLTSVAVDPEKSTFVIAGSTFSGVDVDQFVAKFALGQGLEWYSSFSPAGVANEWVRGVDLATNGDVVIVATSDGAADMQWCTFFYPAAGPTTLATAVVPLWGRYFVAGAMPHGPDQPFGVRFDVSSSIAIAGVARRPSDGAHAMVDLRYSRQGMLVPQAPLFTSGWSGSAPDAVLGWAFDAAGGESAMVGYNRAPEPGSSAPLANWAVFRSGM